MRHKSFETKENLCDLQLTKNSEVLIHKKKLKKKKQPKLDLNKM